MVDNPNGEPPIPASTEPKPKSAFVTFISSSTGKLVMGGVALFIALVVVGALAFFFLINTGDQPLAPVVKSTSSVADTETVVPTDPPEQPLDETFTFRNVFAPTVKPAKDPKTTTSDTSSDTTSETATGPKDTLILKSITVESGERVATFEWNGAVYSVREGDQVADSPWEVVTIHSDSVLMLYGDSRVTLTVGQGFSDTGSDNTK